MKKLFIDYLNENTLNEVFIKTAHEWLKNHIKNQSNVLSIRATGKINNLKENAAKNRARLIQLDKIKYHVVYSDNELATWLYINMPKANFFNKSFQDYISEKTMPVAHFGAKAEGDGRFRVERVTRPWVNIRHSHIFDAGLYSKELIIESSESEIISRFMRLVHPINHFLFPDNLEVLAEQNSAPEYQYVAALYMKKKYPEIFEEFIELIKPGIDFRWNEHWEVIAKKQFDTLIMPRKREVAQLIVTQPISISQARSLPHDYQFTSFRVTENMYQALIINHQPALKILVQNGARHPNGIYIIPRDVAIAFILTKRPQDHWINHACFSSNSIPSELARYFKPAP